MTSPLVKQIIVVTFFRIILNTARRFVYPFAPALSRTLDVPLAALTTVIATGQFTSLLGIFSGPLADRIGYRFMMRSGLMMLAIGMLICGLVPTYWPVFFGLVLASFGKTIFDPAIQAFVSQHVPYSRRGRAVGAIETAWAGSTLIAIPALGLVIGHIGLQSSFFILAAFGALGWLTLGFIIPPANEKPEAKPIEQGVISSILVLFTSRPTAGMLGFGFWISIANDSLFVVYGAWLEQSFAVSLVALGFSTVAIGCAELLGETFTAMFSDRIGLKKTIIIGVCCASLAYAALPFLGISLSFALVGMFFVFFFFEFAMVTSFSLCTELHPGARATMMSGFYATSGIGRMFGVLLGGILWQFGGIKAVAFSAAGSTFVGLFFLLWGLKKWTPTTLKKS